MNLRENFYEIVDAYWSLFKKFAFERTNTLFHNCVKQIKRKKNEV